MTPDSPRPVSAVGPGGTRRFSAAVTCLVLALVGMVTGFVLLFGWFTAVDENIPVDGDNRVVWADEEEEVTIFVDANASVSCVVENEDPRQIELDEVTGSPTRSLIGGDRVAAWTFTAYNLYSIKCTGEDQLDVQVASEAAYDSRLGVVGAWFGGSVVLHVIGGLLLIGPLVGRTRQSSA